MGFNVYFCDVCGVRVTDVDLRSGHGMLRGHDVICATCLEMGYGKEWLTSRGMSEPLPAYAAADNGLSSAADVNLVISHARDRAQTVHDGPSASGPRAAIDYEDTRAVVIQQEASFSGAAAGFAALSSHEQTAIRDDDGRLEEESSDQVDPVLLNDQTDEGSALPSDQQPTSPARSDPGQEPASVSPAIAHSGAASPPRVVAKSKSDRLQHSSAVRTSPSSPAKSSAKRPPTGMSPASNAKSGSTKPSKNSTSSSARAKPGGGMPMPLKISLITVPLLLIAVVFLAVSGPSAAAKQADVKDLQAQKAQIEKEFSEVKEIINSAYASRKVPEMKAANQRWQQFLGEWDGFAKDAQQYSGWTDEQCDSYWEGLRAPDVGARTRLLRDEIAKQSAH